VQLETPQHGLGGAITLVVTQFHSAHVEGCGIGRHVVRIVDEYELRVPVEVALDEPRARDPIDMTAAASCPSHEVASTT
jgi:hypothetical protein